MLIWKHIKSFFHRDKYEYWFRHFTDEERKLNRMDVWQLASIIKNRSPYNNSEEKRIVAEHLLNVRLGRIQARATWAAGFLGFSGGILGAVLSIIMLPMLHDKSDAYSNPQGHCEKQNINNIKKETVNTAFNTKPLEILKIPVVSHKKKYTPHCESNDKDK